MIAQDKILHFIAGALIAGLVGYFTAPVAGFVAAALVGLAKESYDMRHPAKHTADVLDFVATVLGGFAETLILIFAERL